MQISHFEKLPRVAEAIFSIYTGPKLWFLFLFNIGTNANEKQLSTKKALAANKEAAVKRRTTKQKDKSAKTT